MQRRITAQGQAALIATRADLSNLGRLAKKLEAKHMTKVRAAIGRIGVQVGREILRRGGEVDPGTGTPWAPRKRTAKHPLLRRTGEMLAARVVRYKRGRGGIRQLVIFFTAKKSFRSKRFWVHVKGDRRRNLPPRPHIGFSTADMDRIRMRAYLEVEEAMDQARHGDG